MIFSDQVVSTKYVFYFEKSKYFEKTSLGIFQLSKQYKFVTFIDCQSLFNDSRGQILTNYFKNDLVHLNTVSSKMLAQHVFNEICKRK